VKQRKIRAIIISRSYIQIKLMWYRWIWATLWQSYILFFSFIIPFSYVN